MRWFSVSVLVVAISCRGAAPAPDTARVRSDLERFHSQFDSLYRIGDAPGIGQRLTDSAVISAIELPDLRGREAIQSILASFFAGNAVTEYTLRLTELDVAGAKAFGRGTFVWASGPQRAAVASRRGRFAAVYQRDSAGTWRLHRLIENLLPPATP
jgi:ketosteroid isomerase-like protein